jgi:hypothetical protein
MNLWLMLVGKPSYIQQNSIKNKTKNVDLYFKIKFPCCIIFSMFRKNTKCIRIRTIIIFSHRFDGWTNMLCRSLSTEIFFSYLISLIKKTYSITQIRKRKKNINTDEHCIVIIEKKSITHLLNQKIRFYLYIYLWYRGDTDGHWSEWHY